MPECNSIFLAPGGYDPLTEMDTRNLVIHESFHAFDCVNNGAPAGALNEGAATWIYQIAFPADNYPGASFAEATYGMNDHVFAVSADVRDSVKAKWRDSVEVIVHGIDVPGVRTHLAQRELVVRGVHIGVAVDGQRAGGQRIEFGVAVEGTQPPVETADATGT